MCGLRAFFFSYLGSCKTQVTCCHSYTTPSLHFCGSHAFGIQMCMWVQVMVITMLCALLVLCLPRIGSQHPIFRGAVFLLALANGCVGLLLHYANALPALEKGSFTNAQGFVGI